MTAEKDGCGGLFVPTRRSVLLAATAAAISPVSRALAGVPEITLEATLAS